jgi:hypothetical protein
MAAARPGVKLSGSPLTVRHTCGARNTRPTSVKPMAAVFVGFMFVILNYAFMIRILLRFETEEPEAAGDEGDDQGSPAEPVFTGAGHGGVSLADVAGPGTELTATPTSMPVPPPP